MTPIHASVLTTIGNTPVIRLNTLAPEGVELFVKVESLQSRRLGQGPPGAWDHRGGRA